jgi:hypothetical protein
MAEPRSPRHAAQRGKQTTMTFDVGATIEQRYPGSSQEAARLAAAARIAAFEAAGWSIAGERWEGASTSDRDPLSLPKYAAEGGALIITFTAIRRADVPPLLSHTPLEPEPASPVSGYVIRLIAILVVFAVALAVILVIAGPVITAITAPTHRPIGG